MTAAGRPRSLLVTFDYPPAIGGIALVLDRFWRLAGHDGCVILAPRGPGDDAVDRGHPVRTVRFPAPDLGRGAGKLLTFAAAAAWLARQVARQGPELVVAGQLARAGALAWAWHCLTGRPYDLWVYGGETQVGFARTRLLTRCLHRVLRKARTVYSISPFTTAEMVAFGVDPGRIVELPMGVDRVYRPAPKDPELTARYGLADRLVVLTVARLVERKGVDRMLQALSALRDELPPWHYLVVSDGPFRPVLEGMARDLGLADRVTFTGFVAAADLPRYYNLCDLFAMPNREVVDPAAGGVSVEGFGIVFLEAAACGKPVIAGRSGGAVHAVDDGVTGLLVDGTDLASLTAALRALADPARRAAMGAAGVAFARRFDWERSAAILARHM